MSTLYAHGVSDDLPYRPICALISHLQLLNDFSIPPPLFNFNTRALADFGARVLVELHIVLDPLMPLRDANDIGEALEVAVERLREVERCFVHLDTEFDHEPEYKRREGAAAIFRAILK